MRLLSTIKMNVTWLNGKISPKEITEDLIHLEYDFRKRITQKILLEMEKYDWDALDDMHFDFCPDKKTFSLSLNTPEPYYSHFSSLLKL